MRRAAKLITSMVMVLVLGACAGTERQLEAEALVSRARYTVELYKAREDDAGRLFLVNLKNAHGVMIFPAVTKGAFFFGAEGGSGVLLARTEDGSWSYPAFYTLGGGSFGLQVGGQTSEVILVLRSPAAVQAVINHQGKLGADIQATIGDAGSGLQAATTTNVGADIVGFAQAQGVFIGMSLNGAVLARRTDLNQAYYGREPATPKGIVLLGKYWNVQADPLRQALVMSDQELARADQGASLEQKAP